MAQLPPDQAAIDEPAIHPLQGVRVLDLSRVLAGPWCTMTLGDLGADIVKVEHPEGGDDTRGWAPPSIGGESAYFICANRNKRSVAVDISRPEGQEIIRRLALDSDVLVENFRAGALGRYGLDYERIRELNPRIIYCSISGYGRSSPMADRPGYDFVIQAEGGLMSITGEVDGPPMKVGVAVADLFSGMNATQAILAALIARGRTGRGQHIDIALIDGQIAMLANVASACLVSGKRPGRYGNAHATTVPYQIFETSDADIALAIGNDRQFAILCRAVLGLPELVEDERFRTNSARVRNRGELLPVLQARFKEGRRASWLQKLLAAGLPAGSVRGVDEALAAPEVAARGMVEEIDHPTAGRIRLIGSPLKLSDTPIRKPSAPPLLGQHTREILRGRLDYSDEVLEALEEAGIIAPS